MGSRWTLSLDCAFCKKENKEVYYAPTCGFLNFTCKYCGRENGIEEKFIATPFPLEEDESGNINYKVVIDDKYKEKNNDKIPKN